jgi:hypothetical protein
MSSGAEGLAVNAAALAAELDWAAAVLQSRLALHFGQAQADPRTLMPPAPPAGSALADLIAQASLGWEERAVLALALAPHLRPQMLDLLFVRNTNLDRGFAEFGGARGRVHGGFLPTGETAAFLVGGEDLATRLRLRALFDDSHPLHRLGLLRLDHDGSTEPLWTGLLLVGTDWLERLCTGEPHKPDYNVRFPAKRLTTSLGWSDLVLAPDVMTEVAVLQTWIARGAGLMQDWGLARSLKPGYRSLFVGPPGTGKTLTACLLAQQAGLDLYRIDLSMLVSKYIGETEKNLAQVFDQASQRDWVLFFDEADALFGKRTATSSSHDRYANQEVAYLLQRVEDFPGTVILASNLRGNIDDAFARRFQSQILFPMPGADERLRLWQGLLAPPCRVQPDLSLQGLARDHVLSGGAIANAVRHAALLAVGRGGDGLIGLPELEQGVAKELQKEGRTR